MSLSSIGNSGTSVGRTVKPINIRCCVSCRTSRPKSDLLRVIRCHVTGVVLLDEGMGRSAYVCPSQPCIELAQKKRRLSRALRTNVRPEIYTVLFQRLAE